MDLDTIYFTHRFPRLRAIWALLRDGSVIWNVDMTPDSNFTTRSGKIAPGIVVLHGVTVEGQPLGMEHLYPAEAVAQEDDTTIAADEDIEAQ